jgi:[acyl-carrier-protein] S-malonyltransferase
MNLFMFPGQGSQYVAMTDKLTSFENIAKPIFDEAHDILHYNLFEIIENGPMEKLTNTSIAQPAIFTMNYIYQQVVLKSFQPDITMGHSLGEYSALLCAGSLSFEQGLKLVQKRGSLMDQASKEIPGKMVALNRVVKEDIAQVVEECSRLGVIEITNFNSPKQFVLSGENEAIDEAVKIINDRKICIAIPLNVSAPFHSSIMKKISSDFEEYLSDVDLVEPKIRFIDNVSGNFETESINIKKKLVEQLYKPVCWVQGVETAVNAGVDNFYECGPGQVLTGLVKKYDRKLNIQKGESLVQSL